MNKFYLVVRIILLVALLFLLTSVFWGLANRQSTADVEDSRSYDQYRGSRPAGYTSVILIVLVVLGIFLVLASIVFEYHQSRRGPSMPGSEDKTEGEKTKNTWT